MLRAQLFLQQPVLGAEAIADTGDSLILDMFLALAKAEIDSLSPGTFFFA